MGPSNKQLKHILFSCTNERHEFMGMFLNFSQLFDLCALVQYWQTVVSVPVTKTRLSSEDFMLFFFGVSLEIIFRCFSVHT